MKGSQKLWFGILALLIMFSIAYFGSKESVQIFITSYLIQLIILILIITSVIDFTFAVTGDGKECIKLWFWNSDISCFIWPVQALAVVSAILNPIRHLLLIMSVILEGIVRTVGHINTWADKNL